jgi:hypothetical protein
MLGVSKHIACFAFALGFTVPAFAGTHDVPFQVQAAKTESTETLSPTAQTALDNFGKAFVDMNASESKTVPIGLLSVTDPDVQAALLFLLGDLSQKKPTSYNLIRAKVLLDQSLVSHIDKHAEREQDEKTLFLIAAIDNAKHHLGMAEPYSKKLSNEEKENKEAEMKQLSEALAKSPAKANPAQDLLSKLFATEIEQTYRNLAILEAIKTDLTPTQKVEKEALNGNRAVGRAIRSLLGDATAGKPETPAVIAAVLALETKLNEYYASAKLITAAEAKRIEQAILDGRKMIAQSKPGILKTFREMVESAGNALAKAIPEPIKKFYNEAMGASGGGKDVAKTDGDKPTAEPPKTELPQITRENAPHIAGATGSFLLGPASGIIAHKLTETVLKTTSDATATDQRQGVDLASNFLATDRPNNPAVVGENAPAIQEPRAEMPQARTAENEMGAPKVSAPKATAENPTTPAKPTTVGATKSPTVNPVRAQQDAKLRNGLASIGMTPDRHGKSGASLFEQARSAVGDLAQNVMGNSQTGNPSTSSSTSSTISNLFSSSATKLDSSPGESKPASSAPTFPNVSAAETNTSVTTANRPSPSNPNSGGSNLYYMAASPTAAPTGTVPPVSYVAPDSLNPDLWTGGARAAMEAMPRTNGNVRTIGRTANRNIAVSEMYSKSSSGEVPAPLNIASPTNYSDLAEDDEPTVRVAKTSYGTSQGPATVTETYKPIKTQVEQAGVALTSNVIDRIVESAKEWVGLGEEEPTEARSLASIDSTQRASRSAANAVSALLGDLGLSYNAPEKFINAGRKQSRIPTATEIGRGLIPSPTDKAKAFPTTTMGDLTQMLQKLTK